MPDGAMLLAVYGGAQRTGDEKPQKREDHSYVYRSTDDGKTWSEPKQITPDNVHPADLVLLPDGRVLMTTGYRVEPYGVRGLIGDAEGNFDGAQPFTLVSDALSRDCGYPSSVALKDGRALTLYYATRCKDHADWKVHCGAVVYVPPSTEK